MANDGVKKTIGITLIISLICSVFVSIAAVFLHDKQEENKKLEVVKKILSAGGLDFNEG